VTPDEFIGVPRSEWHDLTSQVSRLSFLLSVVILIVGLLLLTLIRNGTIESVTDLFRIPVPGV
jgi:hypothetical protein